MISQKYNNVSCVVLLFVLVIFCQSEDRFFERFGYCEAVWGECGGDFWLENLGDGAHQADGMAVLPAGDRDDLVGSVVGETLVEQVFDKRVVTVVAGKGSETAQVAVGLR